MNKKNIMWIIVVILIAGAFVGITSLSTLSTDDFNECKFVLETNVCDSYSDCIYDSSRDASCIKGYEIVGSNFVETSPQEVPHNTELSDGGSSDE